MILIIYRLLSFVFLKGQWSSVYVFCRSLETNRMSDILFHSIITIATLEFRLFSLCTSQIEYSAFYPFNYQDAISQIFLGGKLAAQLVYFAVEQEPLNFSETAPWIICLVYMISLYD